MPSKPRPARSAASSKKPAVRASARTPKSTRPAAAKKATAARVTASAARVAKSRSNGRPGKPADGKRPSSAASRRALKPAAGRGSNAPPRIPVVANLPSGPSSHDLAMEVFERGFRALQVRNFREAAGILGSIIERYPDEKELHERARVYIAICERQSDPKRGQAPRTIEERMNAATVAINRGAFAEALAYLRSVKSEDAENDVVHYLLAVAHAGLGDADAAIPHLHEAIELNPENRFLAAQDADLDPIRAHTAFVALLDSPPPPRRRTTTRTRSTR